MRIYKQAEGKNEQCLYTQQSGDHGRKSHLL